MDLSSAALPSNPLRRIARNRLVSTRFARATFSESNVGNGNVPIGGTSHENETACCFGGGSDSYVTSDRRCTGSGPRGTKGFSPSRRGGPGAEPSDHQCGYWLGRSANREGLHYRQIQ